jgi:hypothetical protein
MKHPRNRELFDYWNERRGSRAAPERIDIEPGAIRSLLGDSFVLSCVDGKDAQFRVAGTRLCALFGRELRGQTFSTIWDDESAADLRDLLTIVMEDVTGIAAGARTGIAGELSCNVELLVLPLAHRGRLGARMLGALAALERPYWLGIWPAEPLRLATVQYVPGPAAVAPRPTRADVWRSLTVIDGGQGR